ncbi:MAG: pirin family protein [Actinobacteria bacterium]|nr:pirin family protein [Actinomycetota bacterium]
MADATTSMLIHRTPDDYHVIGPDDFGAPGLWAHESIGPFTDVRAFGTLVTVHDSRFDPGKGIGHHPHRGMERLFYILQGGVDHDDSFNDIQGHMGTGDLGILTEGQRGMVHSEWNSEDDVATRAYILVYPTDPTPPTAAFDAIRGEEAERIEPASGVSTKRIVDGGSDRLCGDLRVLADTELDEGAELPVEVSEDEVALVFVVEGEVEVVLDDERTDGVGTGHTVLVPPADGDRTFRVDARTPSRVLHVITAEGFGLRFA